MGLWNQIVNHCGNHARKRAPGFSMIETLIAVGLGGILLTLSVYGIGQIQAREELDGVVRAIVYDVASGQQAAIAQRTTVTVTFQNQSYALVTGTSVLRSDTLPSHISFNSVMQTVTFDRRGLPAGALTLTLTSARAGRTYTISVDAGTGRVTFAQP